MVFGRKKLFLSINMNFSNGKLQRIKSIHVIGYDNSLDNRFDLPVIKIFVLMTTAPLLMLS